jgi:hypothetical protein
MAFSAMISHSRKVFSSSSRSSEISLSRCHWFGFYQATAASRVSVFFVFLFFILCYLLAWDKECPWSKLFSARRCYFLSLILSFQ